MQPNGYFHATYSAGCVSVRDSLVDVSLGVQTWQPLQYLFCWKCQLKGTRRLMRVSACSQTATSMPGSVSDRDSLT